MKNKCKAYGPTILRIVLGLLFFIPGMIKIMEPSGIIGMIGGLGFPAAAFLGWVVILSEIIFGAALIIGAKISWVVWPLFVIMTVALSAVAIPNISQPMGAIGVLWHILAMGGLVSLYFSGPGAMSLCAYIGSCER